MATHTHTHLYIHTHAHTHVRQHVHTVTALMCRADDEPFEIDAADAEFATGAKEALGYDSFQPDHDLDQDGGYDDYE